MPTITPIEAVKNEGFSTYRAKCSVTVGQGETLLWVRVQCWPNAEPSNVQTSTLFQDEQGNWTQSSIPFPAMSNGPYTVKFEAEYSAKAFSGNVNVQGS